MITAQSEEPAETQETKTTGDVTNGSCACKEEDKPITRFNSRVEEDRRETIAFENQLQNTVQYLQVNFILYQCSVSNVTNTF